MHKQEEITGKFKTQAKFFYFRPSFPKKRCRGHLSELLFFSFHVSELWKLTLIILGA